MPSLQKRFVKYLPGVQQSGPESCPSSYIKESNRHTFFSFFPKYIVILYFVLFSCFLLHPYLVCLTATILCLWMVFYCAWCVLIPVLYGTLGLESCHYFAHLHSRHRWAGQVRGSSPTGLSLGRAEQQPLMTLLGCSIEGSWNTHIFRIVIGGFSLSLFCWLGLAEIVRSMTTLTWKSCSCQSSSFEKSRSFFFS